MDILVQWLVLSVAVAIGWCLGYFSQRKNRTSQSASSRKEELEDKFKLLFESYDNESIDSFVQSLEVNIDTLSMHLSIGAHFRSKGEVDKAILIHQNLMSRPDLPIGYDDQVTYELAKDYVAAGLLDRGEGLLLQLQTSKVYGQKSKRLLVDIFQQEKEWGAALSKAMELDDRRHGETAQMISHLYCELADQQLREGHRLEALKTLKEALVYDKSNVRAYSAIAECYFQNGDRSEAIVTLRKAIEQDLALSPYVLNILAKYSVETNSEQRFYEYLRTLSERYPSASVVEYLCMALSRQQGVGEASEKLMQAMKDKPNLKLLECWVDMNADTVVPISKNDWQIMKGVIEAALSGKPRYRCRKCGFAGTTLYWQCPSCQSWGRIKPIQGVEGE